MEKSQLKFGNLKASHVILALGITLTVGGYGWHLYSLFRDAQLNLPQPQIEKLTKDLRLFQSKTGHFPNNFAEINTLLWRMKPTLDYGKEGRQVRTKNYYYFYTRVNDEQCAIWAIPLGPRRLDAATLFLVVTPGWRRLWQGKALDESVIANLPAIPNAGELSKLQLNETSQSRH